MTQITDKMLSAATKALHLAGLRAAIEAALAARPKPEGDGIEAALRAYYGGGDWKGSMAAKDMSAAIAAWQEHEAETATKTLPPMNWTILSDQRNQPIQDAQGHPSQPHEAAREEAKEIAPVRGLFWCCDVCKSPDACAINGQCISAHGRLDRLETRERIQSAFNDKLVDRLDCLEALWDRHERVLHWMIAHTDNVLDRPTLMAWMEGRDAK